VLKLISLVGEEELVEGRAVEGREKLVVNCV